MPIQLGDAIVTIRADDKPLDAALGGARQKVTGWLGNLATGVLQGVGQAAFGGITNGAKAVVGQFGAMIQSASSLNESLNKIGVVFGDQSEGIVDWSKNAATALGQSQQQALEAAGTFGNLFTSMGIGQDKSADMSKGLVQLASDLASFNNIDPAEALDKLRSGIVGETEPLRTLGVNLSAAAVEMKAMAMTGKDSAKQLTEQEKVAARYALILEQTKNSQGDFARTSDGLANSQRILSAQWTDLTTTVGSALLPIFAQLVSTLSSLATKAMPVIADFIQNQMVPAFTTLAAAIGPMIRNFIDLAGPVMGAVFSTLGNLPKILESVGTSFGVSGGAMAEVFSKLQAVFQLLLEVVGKGLAKLGEFWERHGEQVMAVLGPILDILGTVLITTLDTVLDAVELFLQVLNGDWSGAGETLKGIIQRLWDAIVAIFADSLAAASALFTSFFSGTQEKVDSGLGGWSKSWAGWFSNHAKAMQQWNVDTSNSLNDALNTWAANAVKGGSNLIQGLWDGVSGKWNEFWDWLTQNLAALHSQWPFSLIPDSVWGTAAGASVAPLAAPRLSTQALAGAAAAPVTNYYNYFDQSFGQGADIGLARSASSQGVQDALRARGR